MTEDEQKNYSLRNDLASLAQMVGPNESLPIGDLKMPLGIYVGQLCPGQTQLTLALMAVRLARAIEEEIKWQP